MSIEHVYITPSRPRLNGKVERSHRIDDDEFYRILDDVVIDDIKLLDYSWPHGALGGQTLYERFLEKAGLAA